MNRDQKKTLTIGEKIRELRLKRSWTLAVLAEKIGCAPNTIAGWERDAKRAPGKRYLNKVAQSLGVSLDYLLALEEVTPQVPCYGAVASLEFQWKNDEIKRYIEIMSEDYTTTCFALQIVDGLLEPFITAGDYAIFDKHVPLDGSIVIVRFFDSNKAIIRRWRQHGNFVMLSECSFVKSIPSYGFQIQKNLDEKLTYLIQSKTQEKIVVEGKLIGVKREDKGVICYRKIN